MKNKSTAYLCGRIEALTILAKNPSFKNETGKLFEWIAECAELIAKNESKDCAQGDCNLGRDLITKDDIKEHIRKDEQAVFGDEWGRALEKINKTPENSIAYYCDKIETLLDSSMTPWGDFSGPCQTVNTIKTYLNCIMNIEAYNEVMKMRKSSDYVEPECAEVDNSVSYKTTATNDLSITISDNKSVHVIKEMKDDIVLKDANVKDSIKIDGEYYVVKERLWIQNEDTGLWNLRIFVENAE